MPCYWIADSLSCEVRGSGSKSASVFGDSQVIRIEVAPPLGDGEAIMFAFGSVSSCDRVRKILHSGRSLHGIFQDLA